MPEVDVDDLKEQAICSECIGEPYLRGLVKKEGTERECQYCGRQGASITLDELAGEIERAFERHYTRTSSEMDALQWIMHRDPESDYSWERDGEPTVDAITGAADISEQAARDVQAILDDAHSDSDSAAIGEETEFSEDAHYEEIMPTDGEWQEGWWEFERTIKSEGRFFSRTAARQLGALFDDINELRTYKGRSMIVAAGPGTKLTQLFRARVFQSSSKLKQALERPDRDVGAPPSELASAGRMNAKGISVFYGATKAEIALAEVRPPVGSEVIVGRFEIIRTLRLLDLNALKDVHEKGSIFDPGYANRLARTMFLRRLCDRMSRPVMPDDEDFEYLTTQAVADYLATEGKVPLEGILFPSVQAGNKGLNVVLFHKASRCEEIDMPAGTEIIVMTGFRGSEDDEEERNYSVYEDVPKPEPKPEEPNPPAHPFLSRTFAWQESEPSARPWDNRQVTLRVDLKSLQVHVIEAVTFKTRSHSVHRHRSVKDKDASV